MVKAYVDAPACVYHGGRACDGELDFEHRLHRNVAPLLARVDHDPPASLTAERGRGELIAGGRDDALHLGCVGLAEALCQTDIDAL